MSTQSNIPNNLGASNIPPPSAPPAPPSAPPAPPAAPSAPADVVSTT